MGQNCTCQNPNSSRNLLETEAIQFSSQSESKMSIRSIPKPKNPYQLSSSGESDEGNQPQFDQDQDHFCENEQAIKQLVETFIVQSGNSRDSWCIRIIPEDKPVIQFKKTSSLAQNIEKKYQKADNNSTSIDMMGSTQSLKEQTSSLTYSKQLKEKFTQLEDQLKYVENCIETAKNKKNFQLISFEEAVEGEFYQEEPVPIPKETITHGRFIK